MSTVKQGINGFDCAVKILAIGIATASAVAALGTVITQWTEILWGLSFGGRFWMAILVAACAAAIFGWICCTTYKRKPASEASRYALVVARVLLALAWAFSLISAQTYWPHSWTAYHVLAQMVSIVLPILGMFILYCED